MKNINDIIAENLHKFSDIEQQLTNEFFKLIPTNMISLNIDVDGFNIDFNDEFEDKYQCVGIIIENYLKQILVKELSNFDEKSKIVEILSNYKEQDMGEYDNYDYACGNICFEIKCSHDINKFYITNKQKSEIGKDAFFILVNFELAKNNIMITDLFVKKVENIRYSGNYLRSK